MSTRGTRAGDDRKGDAKTEGNTNLEDTAECRHTELLTSSVCSCKRESTDGCDTREDIEKDTSGFGHHFSKDARSSVLEVDLSLRDRLGLVDMASDVPVFG